MKRREFITLLGGAAVASPMLWPLAAHAQQPERIRRIGVLSGIAETDPESQRRYSAFRQGLQQLGWTEGRNFELHFRSGWGVGNIELLRRHVADLIALAPDIILASGALTVVTLQQTTRTIPIVFAGLTDPVGAGFVESLARPGGNTTGFTSFEYGLGTKWLELLKEIAPRITRVGVMRDSISSTGVGFWAAMQGAAPSAGLELRSLGVRDAPEIERAVAGFARESGGGLIVTVGNATLSHRDLIIALAARHNLPVVYPFRYFATAGGLM